VDIERIFTDPKRPPDCTQGDMARLIPVMDWKETHLLGFFLAALQAIPTFSRTILDLVDGPKGKSQNVECFTEVVFKTDKQQESRCDGLIVVRRGKSEWRAIVEAKIGNSEIDGPQIEKYLRLARENRIDAVLTISNEFVPRPTDSPVKISGLLTRSVKLFHLSWWTLLTEALLAQHNAKSLSTTEEFLIGELLRACLHPKSKIIGFSQMHKGWKDTVSKVQSNSLQKSDPDSEATATDWVQEQKELALILSRNIGKKAALWQSSKHREPTALRKAIINSLTQRGLLSCQIRVADVAGPIEIRSEVKNRRHLIYMKLRAPEDKVSGKARLNWLLRQLAKCKDERVTIFCLWPGNAAPSHRKLSELRTDPDALLADRPTATPHSFEIALIDDLGSRYAMPKVFIERLETACLAFYNDVAVNLRAWQPPAPKPVVVELEGHARNDH